MILLFPCMAMIASASQGRASSRAAAMMILSYLLVNSGLAFDFIEHFHVGVPAPFQPPNGSLFRAATSGCGFLSLLSAWLGCYLWAADGEAARSGTIDDVYEPSEAVLRRRPRPVLSRDDLTASASRGAGA